MKSPPLGGGGVTQTSPPRKKSRHRIQEIDCTLNFPNLTPTPRNTKPQDNPKFVVIKSTDSEKPLNNINIFLLSKAINGLISENNRLMTKFTRDGNLLILTKTTRHAELLIKTKKLSNICDITCSYHEKLNFVKGVVFCPALKKLNEAEIIKGLAKENVIEAYKIKKMIDGKLENTPLHILTFDLYKKPDEIFIGFDYFSVDHYIPKPMQCKNCYKIGHTQKRCSNVQLCQTCSLIFHGDDTCSQFPLSPTLQQNIQTPQLLQLFLIQ
ncbi:uncharacterized protein LOC142230934 [Haematobia irritans]|uniref:uncharacterized protein LOC142230934 n=1 Tax=Haematobia irritans TaxID=7368 RepID=UPI003F4F852A